MNAAHTATLDRETAQMLITKLDLRHTTVAEVKNFLKTCRGITITSRTYDAAAREIGKLSRGAA